MEADRIKWNARFESRDSYLGERPSPFLSQEIMRIKACVHGVSALDIACGEGRNSLFLARHGFCVTALDISDVGLGKARKRAADSGLEIDFRNVDLEDYCMAETYDVILNFNFLLRNLIPKEVAALNPGGLLLFDTIMATEQLLKTRTSAYLLHTGEIESIFSNYDGRILYSEEIIAGEMPTARLLFQKSR